MQAPSDVRQQNMLMHAAHILSPFSLEKSTIHCVTFCFQATLCAWGWTKCAANIGTYSRQRQNVLKQEWSLQDTGNMSCFEFTNKLINMYYMCALS